LPDFHVETDDLPEDSLEEQQMDAVIDLALMASHRPDRDAIREALARIKALGLDPEAESRLVSDRPGLPPYQDVAPA